jgi:hypothetical protein
MVFALFFSVLPAQISADPGVPVVTLNVYPGGSGSPTTMRLWVGKYDKIIRMMKIIITKCLYCITISNKFTIIIYISGQKQRLKLP